MLKLKLPYFGHLMWKADSLEKTLMLGWLGAGGEGDDDRGWDGWMASLTRWTWVWTPGVGDGQGGLACCDSWGRKELDTTERLNWTERVQTYKHSSSISATNAVVEINGMYNHFFFFPPVYSPFGLINSMSLVEGRKIWVILTYLRGKKWTWIFCLSDPPSKLKVHI